MRFPPVGNRVAKAKIVENCHKTATKTENSEAAKKYFYRLFHGSNLYSQINKKKYSRTRKLTREILGTQRLAETEKYLNRIIFN